MIANALAFLGFLIALLITLGGPFTVFTAWKPGLWFFHRFQEKRSTAILLSSGLCLAAIVLAGQDSRVVWVFPAGIFLLLSLVLNLSAFFPALLSVDVVDAQQVDEEMLQRSFFAGNQDVLVVEFNDEQRAYPLQSMVMARHLVHDIVGGVPIVVTYCAVCHSGLVFRAEMAGSELFFTVTGVFRRNLIMEDSHSRTLWQQATGEGIYGAGKGRILEMLPSFQLPWQEAKAFERMTLAQEPPSSRKAVFSSPKRLAWLEAVTDRVLVPGHTPLGQALDRHETVFGISLNGSAKAYPLSRLQTLDVFPDMIGGVEIELSFDPENQVLLAKRLDRGPDPLVEKHGWLGWKEFHPDTQIYEGASKKG
ncbi:MAG TPA: DUF3179 domain-containing protein [Chloroflexi bacterium]|nr:DUF3179 domain-containing protein [Chloroflexota bacterium]